MGARVVDVEVVSSKGGIEGEMISSRGMGVMVVVEAGRAVVS